MQYKPTSSFSVAHCCSIGRAPDYLLSIPWDLAKQSPLLNINDSWTTQVWNVQVDLHMNFFPINVHTLVESQLGIHISQRDNCLHWSMTFYNVDLSICWCWYLCQVMELSPTDIEGQLSFWKICSFIAIFVCPGSYYLDPRLLFKLNCSLH